MEGSPLALLRPKRPRPAAPASLVASAGVWPQWAAFPPPPPPPPPGRAPPLARKAGVSAISTSAGQRRPSVVLGEAYCQLLPHWRQKCYALLWASLSLDLVTKQCTKNFTQAYK